MTGETKQVITAIIIILAFIPGVITPNSSPIIEAAIIRLNLDEIRKPPEIAFLKPNKRHHSNEGIIFKEDSYGQVINNTFYANNIGVSCIENNAPKSGSYVTIQNCIFSNSVENDVFHDLNSIIDLDYCLSDTEYLPGENNLLDDPLFINAAEYNFNLQEDSPCINAGNPNLPLDPDNTISDIGAFYYNTDTTGINEQDEIFRSLQIYPNPFQDDFTISSQSINAVEISIELYNLQGVILPTTIYSEQSTTVKSFRVKPILKLKSNIMVICKISINGYSKSYLLIHR